MSSLLYAVALLACPVGMGLMMFMMMRGESKPSADQAQGGAADRNQVDALRAEIEALKSARAADTHQPPRP